MPAADPPFTCEGFSKLLKGLVEGHLIGLGGAGFFLPGQQQRLLGSFVEARQADDKGAMAQFSQ